MRLKWNLVALGDPCYLMGVRYGRQGLTFSFVLSYLGGCVFKPLPHLTYVSNLNLLHCYDTAKTFSIIIYHARGNPPSEISTKIAA